MAAKKQTKKATKKAVKAGAVLLTEAILAKVQGGKTVVARKEDHSSDYIAFQRLSQWAKYQRKKHPKLSFKVTTKNPRYPGQVVVMVSPGA